MTPEIYISYAWRDREKDPQPDDREGIVDALCAAFQQEKNWQIRRDKTDLGYRDSIETFMRAIGAGKYVVMVVSAKYLRSEYCMFEAVRVLAHEQFEQRVFPIVLPDADIFSDNALDYTAFWKKRLAELSQKLDDIGRGPENTEWISKERDRQEICLRVADVITRIARLNVLSPAQHLADNFAAVIAAVERQWLSESEAVTQPGSQLPGSLKLPGSSGLPEPVFQKLVGLKKDDFGHALRPSQTMSIAARLPDSLNLTGQVGWGRHRFMDDLEACGKVVDGVRIVRVKLSTYFSDYAAFLREVARLAEVAATADHDLVELLRNSAQQHGRPILFIVENPDQMFRDKPGMDARFDMSFLHKLNTLKNASFAALLLSSYEPVNQLSFRGQTSPLWLEPVALNQLSYEDLSHEVSRQLPDLPDDLRDFIAAQLEFEPRQTHELLRQLLQSLDGRSRASRDFIGQDLIRLKLKH